LSNVIELEGDWEVGLAEISVPSKVENAFNDECYLILQLTEFIRKIRLTARHYEQIEEIIDGLHSALHADPGLSGLEQALLTFFLREKQNKDRCCKQYVGSDISRVQSGFGSFVGIRCRKEIFR